MALSHNDQALIRGYLLGHLNQEEQQKVDERLMVEDDLFEELEISKNELIEEYCSGELNQTETEFFKLNYLSSVEGRKRYAFALALDSLKHPNPAPKPPNWFERFVSLFKQPRWALGATTAMVAAIAAVFATSQLQGPGRKTLAMTLQTSSMNRAPTDTPSLKIRLTPDVGDVKMALALPASETPGATYRVELDNRTGTPETLNLTSQDSGSVSVVIPAKELPPGPYSLRLFAVNPDGSERRVGDYFFETSN